MGAVVVASLAVVPPSAIAADGASGGMSAPQRPHIAGVACADAGAGAGACARGARLRITGHALDWTEKVLFLGRRGARDDRAAAPVARAAGALTVVVPRSARTGPVRLATETGDRIAVARRIAIRGRVATSDATALGAPVVDPSGAVFPIRGKHDLGQSAANNFGGGRGHQGQDMFAACGTPLVAVRAGKVTKAAYHSRAGNYVVIAGDDGQSYLYMHMLRPAVVTQRDRVAAGQRIGQVGETGRATGCHLHFELWTAPGWYMGGKPIDPLPSLRAWERSG